MPSGLEEANQKSHTEKKKPEFIRNSVNGSLNKELNSNRSQQLLELPRQAMILRSQDSEKEEENSSRALMKKAHELHNISKSESKKTERQ